MSDIHTDVHEAKRGGRSSECFNSRMSRLTQRHAATANFDPLLDAQEGADYLKMGTETLLEKARLREIACVRDSRKRGSPVKFRLSALNQWIRAHEISQSRLSKNG